MKVSDEIQNLRPYAPGKPIEETKRELGLEKVYKLASNENPLGPSKRVLEAMRAELEDLHRYPDAGFYKIREAHANKFGLPADWFTFGNGSNEIIDLLIRVFCAPGEAVLASENTFLAYSICTKAARAQFLTSPMEDDMKYDLAALYDVYTKNSDNVRLVFVANPNNPTGTYVSHSELKGFLDKMKSATDTIVVIDEAYLEFVTAEDYPDSLALLKEYDNAVITRTMSKVYGLAGIRIGSLMARPEIIDYIDRVRNPFNVNNLAQSAGIAALDDAEYISEVQRVNKEGLEYFYLEFEGLGLRHWKSQANFVLVEPEMDGKELYQKLLKKGVIVRPMPLRPDKTYLRISIGNMDENEACVAALKQVL